MNVGVTKLNRYWSRRQELCVIQSIWVCIYVSIYIYIYVCYISIYIYIYIMYTYISNVCIYIYIYIHAYLCKQKKLLVSQLFGSQTSLLLRPGLTEASLAPSSSCMALGQRWAPMRDPQLMMSSWRPSTASKSLPKGGNGAWSRDGSEPGYGKWTQKQQIYLVKIMIFPQLCQLTKGYKGRNGYIQVFLDTAE